MNCGGTVYKFKQTKRDKFAYESPPWNRNTRFEIAFQTDDILLNILSDEYAEYYESPYGSGGPAHSLDTRDTKTGITFKNMMNMKAWKKIHQTIITTNPSYIYITIQAKSYFDNTEVKFINYDPSDKYEITNVSLTDPRPTLEGGKKSTTKKSTSAKTKASQNKTSTAPKKPTPKNKQTK